MDAAVRKLFARYESCFNQALNGTMDMEEVAALYAPEFIAASAQGVRAGKNDAQFRQVMAQGYARYRDIGTKHMRVRHIRHSPIDALHCVAHIAWSATYIRKDQTQVSIDFDVHYLVQEHDGALKVFGWVAGDEQALLEQHGIG